jgi:glycosyltransferase involved in cell wall biosynthesis
MSAPSGARAPAADRIRVLLVNQPTDGGVAFHVQTLARCLPDHGVDTTVACPPGPWADDLVASGVAVVEVPMVREISAVTDLAALRRLRAAAGTGGHDLVHTHSAKAGVLGRLAARSRHLPAVHTPHAWSFLAGGRRSAPVYRRIERALARSTDALICVSEGERRRGLQVADAERLTVVANGIALPDAGSERRATDSGVVLGTVARLAPQKGVAHLLEAFALVRRLRPEARLAIAGDGPLRGDLEQLARRLGIADSVTFAGAVSSPWSFLAGLDLFVLPSLWEGLPYALLEAMASGLACVATAVDGVAEAIPDRRFGTVVEPADSAWLGREILALVDDPRTRAQMGEMARAHVREAFSVDGMVRGTVDVYRRVLQGVSGDPRPDTLSTASLR